MSKKPLSAEKVAQLRCSPYVVDVKGGRISFTPEFKRMAYERVVSIVFRTFFEKMALRAPMIPPESRAGGLLRCALP